MRRMQHFRAEDAVDCGLGDTSLPPALCIWVNQSFKLQSPPLEKSNNAKEVEARNGHFQAATPSIWVIIRPLALTLRWETWSAPHH